MSTIVAQSTPPLASAIAIIRLSGEHALPLCSKVFSAFKGDVQPRRAYFGRLDVGTIKDDCLAIYYKAPHSYTGEDMVEINCHGSLAVTRAVLEYFISVGARMAERGEFTRRAFENGKLDLTESEAVIDLINAESEAQARSAFSQLSGVLSQRIGTLQKEITTLIARTEAAIDYPEEDVEEMTSVVLKGETMAFRKKLIDLKATYDSGKIMRSGVKVAIVGLPNAGKSLIMNRLLGYDRSIVSSHAGTTRDYVEESFLYKDMRFSLIDTAGVRQTDDCVEEMGVQRSMDIMKQADVILSVAEPKGQFLLEDDKRTILVENKRDVAPPSKAGAISISALTEEGMDALKDALREKAASLTTIGDGAINNVRHLQAVEEAVSCVDRALDGMENLLPLDLISDDLMGAYRALGSITGITTSDNVVGEIFSRFCVGK